MYVPSLRLTTIEGGAATVRTTSNTRVGGRVELIDTICICTYIYI